jgi:hypothetical protein
MGLMSLLLDLVCILSHIDHLLSSSQQERPVLCLKVITPQTYFLV